MLKFIFYKQLIFLLKLMVIKSDQMTKIGEFLAKKSINRAAISRKTGISKTRLSELSNNDSTKLKADELYLIALAIGVDPGELLEYVCGELKLLREE
jgi:DNA-binding Xre family transcriptional regulator